MKYYLIKMSQDYADEFNVYGMAVMTEEQWNKYQADARQCIALKPNHEYYFGSNEWLEFESVAEFTSAFTATEINETEYAFLSRVFNNHPWYAFPEWGHFVNFTDILSDFEDSE